MLGAWGREGRSYVDQTMPMRLCDGWLVWVDPFFEVSCVFVDGDGVTG